MPLSAQQFWDELEKQGLAPKVSIPTTKPPTPEQPGKRLSAGDFWDELERTGQGFLGAPEPVPSWSSGETLGPPGRHGEASLEPVLAPSSRDKGAPIFDRSTRTTEPTGKYVGVTTTPASRSSTDVELGQGAGQSPAQLPPYKPPAITAEELALEKRKVPRVPPGAFGQYVVGPLEQGFADIQSNLAAGAELVGRRTKIEPLERLGRREMALAQMQQEELEKQVPPAEGLAGELMQMGMRSVPQLTLAVGVTTGLRAAGLAVLSAAERSQLGVRMANLMLKGADLSQRAKTIAAGVVAATLTNQMLEAGNAYTRVMQESGDAAEAEKQAKKLFAWNSATMLTSIAESWTPLKLGTRGLIGVLTEGAEEWGQAIAEDLAKGKKWSALNLADPDYLKQAVIGSTFGAGAAVATGEIGTRQALAAKMAREGPLTEPRKPQPADVSREQQAGSLGGAPGIDEPPATVEQIQTMAEKAKTRGLTREDLGQLLRQNFGKGAATLTEADATSAIELLDMFTEGPAAEPPKTGPEGPTGTAVEAPTQSRGMTEPRAGGPEAEPPRPTLAAAEIGDQVSALETLGYPQEFISKLSGEQRQTLVESRIWADWYTQGERPAAGRWPALSQEGPAQERPALKSAGEPEAKEGAVSAAERKAGRFPELRRRLGAAEDVAAISAAFREARRMRSAGEITKAEYEARLPELVDLANYRQMELRRRTLPETEAAPRVEQGTSPGVQVEPAPPARPKVEPPPEAPGFQQTYTDETIELPGMPRREVPATKIRTRGKARSEGTPLFEQEAERQRAEAAQAQGDLLAPPKEPEAGMEPAPPTPAAPTPKKAKAEARPTRLRDVIRHLGGVKLSHTIAAELELIPGNQRGALRRMGILSDTGEPSDTMVEVLKSEYPQFGIASESDLMAALKDREKLDSLMDWGELSAKAMKDEELRYRLGAVPFDADELAIKGQKSALVVDELRNRIAQAPTLEDVDAAMEEFQARVDRGEIPAEWFQVELRSLVGDVERRRGELGEKPVPAEASKAPELSQEAEQQPEPKSITDFGEKIGGARKDVWKRRGLMIDDLQEMNERERVEHVTKDNVWPAIDYQAVVESGVPPEVAYVLKQIKDAMPRTPRVQTAEHQEEFISGLSAVRDAVASVRTVSDLKNVSQLAQTIQDRVWRTLGRKAYRAVQVGPSELGRAARQVAYTGWPTKQEPWRKNITIRQTNKPDEWLIVTIKAGRSGALAGPFKTESEAEQHLQTVLRPTLEKRQAGPKIKRPYLAHLKREGLPDYRSGGDVDETVFQETFGFRGGEFGNWENQEERQESLNLAHDGLKDLAAVLKLPDKAISLNGELAIAFGARGRGQYAAHYEPGRMVINLTKPNGAGALAHEWAHALDDYFGRQSEDRPISAPFITGGISAKTGLRPELAEALNNIFHRIKVVALANKPAVDQATRNMKRAEGSLSDWLKAVRAEFGQEQPRVKGTPVRAATDQEVVQFDTMVNRLLSGDQESNRTIGEIAALYKAVKGRLPKAEYRNAMLAWSKQLLAAKNSVKKVAAGEITVTGQTKFVEAAKQLDAKRSKKYWSTAHELFARAFESYVQDKLPGPSQYLVHSASNEPYATTGLPSPYPEGAERGSINEAIDDFVRTVKTKETDQGVVLYQRQQKQLPPRAQIEFYAKQPAVIRLFETADPTSLPHELFHWYKRQLTPEKRTPFEKWMRIDPGQQWSIGHEEQFADATVGLLFGDQKLSDELPTGIRGAVYDFVAWLREVFNAIRTQPNVRLNRDTQSLLEQALGGPEKVREFRGELRQAKEPVGEVGRKVFGEVVAAAERMRGAPTSMLQQPPRVVEGAQRRGAPLRDLAQIEAWHGTGSKMPRGKEEVAGEPARSYQGSVAEQVWQVSRDRLVNKAEIQRDYTRQYVNKQGEQIASSRTVPAITPPFPEGMWVKTWRGAHGEEVEQLRVLRPEDLEASEPVHLRSWGRLDDVKQYRQWIKEGKQPPPIEVVETEGGKLRIVDGHRRWLAAKRERVPIRAWVSPTTDLPGRTASDGKPIKVGLTWELAVHKAIQEGRGVPAEQRDNLPPLERLTQAAKEQGKGAPETLSEINGQVAEILREDHLTWRDRQRVRGLLQKQEALEAAEEMPGETGGAEGPPEILEQAAPRRKKGRKQPKPPTPAATQAAALPAVVGQQIAQAIAPAAPAAPPPSGQPSALDEARAMRRRAKDLEKRYRTSIVRATVPGSFADEVFKQFEGRRGMINTVAHDTYEDLKELDVLTNMTQKLTGKKLSVVKNPMSRAQLYRGVQGLGDVMSETWGRVIKGGLLGRKPRWWHTVPRRDLDNLEVFVEARMIQRREGVLRERFPKRDIATFNPEGKTAAWAKTVLDDLRASVTPEQFKAYQRTARHLGRFWKVMLGYTLDAGLISQAAYDKIVADQLAYGDYLGPFRVIAYAAEHLEQAERMPKSLSVYSQDAVKAMVGTTKLVQDLLVSSPQKIYRTAQLAERNKVMRTIYGMRHLNPQIKDVILSLKPTEDAPAGFKKVYFYQAGERLGFGLPAPIAESIQGLDRASANWLLQAFGKWTGLLRVGAVSLSPTFSLRNPFRDMLTQGLKAEFPLNPLNPSDIGLMLDSLFGAAFGGNRRIAREYKKWGASYSSRIMQFKPERQSAELTRGDLGNLMDHPHRALWLPAEMLFHVSGISEETTRLSGFRKTTRERARKKGEARPSAGTMMEGALASRTNSIDFRRGGKIFQTLNLIRPFVNARVQGFRTEASGIKDHPVRAAALAMSAMAVAAYLRLRDREEYGDLVDDIPEYKRRDNWICILDTFVDGEGKERPFFGTIPKGDFFRAITVPAEDFVDHLYTQQGDAFHSLVSVLAEVSPFSFEREGTFAPDKMAMELMPPPVQAVIETQANYSSYRGQALVSPSEEERKPEHQYRPYSSWTARELGQVMHWSPLKIDHAAATMMGEFGRMLMRAPELVVGAPKGRKTLTPQEEWAYVPGVKAFISTAGGERESQIHDAISDAEKEAGSARFLRQETVRSLLQEWPDLSAAERRRRLVSLSLDPAQKKVLERELKRRATGFGPGEGIYQRLQGTGIADGERAVAIRNICNTVLVTAEARAAFLRELADRKILTDDIVRQLIVLADKGEIQLPKRKANRRKQ